MRPEDTVGMKFEQLTLAHMLLANAPAPVPDEGPDMEEDPLYPHARRAVIKEQKASAGMLQRIFRISYVRADRLITRMEIEGVIGPHTPGGYRKIMIDNDEEE